MELPENIQTDLRQTVLASFLRFEIKAFWKIKTVKTGFSAFAIFQFFKF